MKDTAFSSSLSAFSMADFDMAPDVTMIPWSPGSIESPAKFNIPLVPIWNRLRKDLSFDGKVDVLPLLKVTAEDEDERLVWTIPPELVPGDFIELDRSNRQWGRFLRIEKVNRKKR
jgi:hypothetical protein